MQLRTHFSRKDHSDSGLALLLITLIAGFWFNHQLASRLAIAEVLILLVAPVLVFPFTFLWLNFSELLGKVSSKILLTIIFFVLVWPVAVFRKAIGKDTLKLKDYKKNANSVFTERNHTYTKTDFTTPY